MNDELSIFNPKFKEKIEKICKAFSDFGDHIKIIERETHGQWTILKLKTKATTEKSIRAHIPDIQIQLNIKRMVLLKEEQVLYLAVTDFNIKYPSLSEILTIPNSINVFERKELPFAVGFGIIKPLIVYDLSQFPHLLFGGSTNSGKTVGLQGFITTLAYTKSPNEVNFVIVDIGATKLRCFNELPHISCSVVEERESVPRVLSSLLDELERRIELEYADRATFAMLPRIVLVIDEVPALFLGLEKDDLKLVVRNISALLQRGRHGRIHVVLAGQDPTRQNMLVDLSNITARVAYKCDRWQNSVTILGKPGAETLTGKGELLMKGPQIDGLQRLQGIFVSDEELSQLIQQIRKRYQPSECDRKFTIPDGLYRGYGPINSGVKALPPIAPKPSIEEQIFAQAMLFAFGRDEISANALRKEFETRKADARIKRLEGLGIVETLNGKLSRRVIPTEVGDLPSEMLDFLSRNGISEDEVRQAFASRNRGRK